MKALIFDMDGVIVDSEPMHTEVTVELMQKHGVVMEPKDMVRFAGCNMNHIFGTLREENALKVTVEDLSAEQLEGMIRHTMEEPQEPISGILEILEHCKMAGIPMAIASSSPLSLIDAVVDRLNLRSYFSLLLSGDDFKASKPHPDIYFTAAKKLGVEPKDCVVIEDSMHGVKAAKAAGMICIGFLNPNSGMQDLSEADVCVHAMKEIAWENF